MFVILQKYDFSSKSQLRWEQHKVLFGCLWYCKSTIFQANHNPYYWFIWKPRDVCDTAKVRFFKQITTKEPNNLSSSEMFVILQKYDFSSKSQLHCCPSFHWIWCLWYCKSTIFQANHNTLVLPAIRRADVCDTAKVRFFKQITTYSQMWHLFDRCLWYCKSTIFQANHNIMLLIWFLHPDVCDTAKVRFFKQITTGTTPAHWLP